MSILMKINTKKSLSLCMIGIITAIIYFNNTVPTSKDINCYSTFELSDNSLEPYFVGNLHFEINQEKKKGSANFKGRLNVSHNGQNDSEVYLLKNLNFDIKSFKQGVLTLNNFSLTSNSRNQVSDDIFIERIVDISVKERKIMLSKLGDGYVIHNIYSPILICTPQS
jgi:hypothetical protein